MYTVNNNHIGTCTSYLSLFIQRLGFTLFMTQFRRLPVVGLRIFAPLRKWTLYFGAGYNHPAVVVQPFFLTWTTLRYYSYTLICVSWVGTHNQANLKLLSGHKNIRVVLSWLRQPRVSAKFEFRYSCMK